MLATGLFGLLSGLIGAAGMLLLLSAIGLLGALLATTLPEVQQD